MNILNIKAIIIYKRKRENILNKTKSKDIKRVRTI